MQARRRVRHRLFGRPDPEERTHQQAQVMGHGCDHLPLGQLCAAAHTARPPHRKSACGTQTVALHRSGSTPSARCTPLDRPHRQLRINRPHRPRRIPLRRATAHERCEKCMPPGYGKIMRLSNPARLGRTGSVPAAFLQPRRRKRSVARRFRSPGNAKGAFPRLFAAAAVGGRARSGSATQTPPSWHLLMCLRSLECRALRARIGLRPRGNRRDRRGR